MCPEMKIFREVVLLLSLERGLVMSMFIVERNGNGLEVSTKDFTSVSSVVNEKGVDILGRLSRDFVDKLNEECKKQYEI